MFHNEITNSNNLIHKAFNPFKYPLREKCPYSELFWSTFITHFPASGLNTERYEVQVSLRIQSGCGKMREKCGKNSDQNNSEYGHFSRSDYNNSLGQKKLPVTLLFLQKCYDNLFIYSPWKHQKIRGLEMFSGAGWGSKKQAFQTSPGGRGPSLITIEIFLRVFGRIWNWVISA